MSKTEKRKRKPPVKKKPRSKDQIRTILKIRKLKNKFFEYYSRLPIQKLAADFIGKDEDTITNWKNKDKNFSDKLSSLKSEWALENTTKIKNREWLLERIMKEHFAEKIETEHTINKSLEEFLNKQDQKLK